MAWCQIDNKSEPMMTVCITWLDAVNSLRLRDAYMCQQTQPSLGQVMAFCLMGTKPLSEAMLAYCKLDPCQQIWMKFESKYKKFSFKEKSLKMLFAKWCPFCLGLIVLTLCILEKFNDTLTHCASNLTIIDSNNGLSPGRHQAIIWTNAEILLIGRLRINFSEIFIEIDTFLVKKIHLQRAKGSLFNHLFRLMV